MHQTFAAKHIQAFFKPFTTWQRTQCFCVWRPIQILDQSGRSWGLKTSCTSMLLCFRASEANVVFFSQNQQTFNSLLISGAWNTICLCSTVCVRNSHIVLCSTTVAHLSDLKQIQFLDPWKQAHLWSWPTARQHSYSTRTQNDSPNNNFDTHTRFWGMCETDW